MRLATLRLKIGEPVTDIGYRVVAAQTDYRKQEITLVVIDDTAPVVPDLTDKTSEDIRYLDQVVDCSGVSTSAYRFPNRLEA